MKGGYAMGLVLKPREMIRFLENQGFTFVRQSGSHAIYSNGEKQTIIPIHAKDIKNGTLSNVLRQTGIDQKVLREWLKRN